MLAVKLVILGSLLTDVPGRLATSLRLVATQESVENEPVEIPTAQAVEGQAQDGTGAAQDDAGAGQEDPARANAPTMPGGEKNEALSRREEEIMRKEQSLQQLEKEIDQKLVRLQQLEAKLSQMIEEAQGIKDAKLKHLIDVYSNMKSKQAAAVLETLDPTIAVKILAGMRGRQAGEILTNVEAKKAAKLTEMLTNLQAPFD